VDTRELTEDARSTKETVCEALVMLVIYRNGSKYREESEDRYAGRSKGRSGARNVDLEDLTYVKKVVLTVHCEDCAKCFKS
jgi:hypothetical protein